MDPQEQPVENRDRRQRAIAASTLRAYASDWAAFTSWCTLQQRAALPASLATVLAYFRSVCGTIRVSSLRRRLVSIRRLHREHGHLLDVLEPDFKDAWSAMAGTASSDARPRRNPSSAEVAALIAALPGNIVGIRDRAMILVGWEIGCRPAELVGMDLDHVAATPRSVVIKLCRARGLHRSWREVTVRSSPNEELCPVRWLKSWLLIAHITDGPVFRSVSRYGAISGQRLSVQAVRIVLRRAAARAGISELDLCADGLRQVAAAGAAA